MADQRCVRCGHGEAEHEPDTVVTVDQMATWPWSSPCHRYEPPAPLLLRALTGVRRADPTDR